MLSLNKLDKVTIVQSQDIESIKPLWIELTAHHDSIQNYVPRNGEYEEGWKTVLHRFKTTNRMLFVAFVNGEQIGYATGVIRPDKTCGDVAGLYVKSQYRGKGIGAQLLDVVIQSIRKTIRNGNIFLGVMAGNETVFKLYESRGFKLTGYNLVQQNPGAPPVR